MSSSLCQAAVQCFNWQDSVIGSRYFVGQRETMCLRRLSYAAKAPRRSRARDLENAGYVEVMCVPLRYRPPRHERPRGSAAATPTITARRSTAF